MVGKSASAFSLEAAPKGRTRGWLVPGAGAVLVALTAAGCAPKSGTLQSYMAPHSLYLAEQPCDRLYVEVDALEGVEVSDRWLAALREFLSEHCSKPGGVEIVRDPPVSAQAVEAMPAEVAALSTLDGPCLPDGSQPAYLHVFFYDARGARKGPTQTSYIDALCPTSIFYRVSRGRHWDERIAGSCLKHEAGHVLGLNRNRAHGDGTHCRNRSCLMRSSLDLRSSAALLFGGSWRASLCADCRRDLEAARSAGADDKLSFVGPFLVRREAGYSVASLPGWHAIVVGPMEEAFDWRKALSGMKATIERRREQLAGQVCSRQSRGDPWCFHPVYAPVDEHGESADRRAVWTALKEALHDPCPKVRHVAAVQLERIEGRLEDETKGG
jgi:hypothetical protein